MSVPVGKGSMVECIKLPNDSELVLGKIYEVQDILFKSPSRPGGIWICMTCRGNLANIGCLVLVGVAVNSRTQLGHCPCHFRPAGKKGDFNDLLTNIPADLREDELLIAKWRDAAPHVADVFERLVAFPVHKRKLGNGNGICRGREQSGGPSQGNPAGHDPVRLPVRSGARGPS